MTHAPETDSPPDAVETDIIGKTDLVGNGEFLLAVFGELVDARPVVVSFEGNPASVPPKVWFGRPWQGTPDMAVSLPASANSYFSLAVFRPDEAGHFRRQKARFQALYAVMLDDIGGQSSSRVSASRTADGRQCRGSLDECDCRRRAVRPWC